VGRPQLLQCLIIPTTLGLDEPGKMWVTYVVDPEQDWIASLRR